MGSLTPKGFKKNVFINCPFDKQYESLLRPLLFVIIYIGYNPQIASQDSDAGIPRIERICKLIKISKYSIHDLSRLKSTKKDEFYRLNMPFELGIDYGCRRFAKNYLNTKKQLILETKRYRYMRAISDLSGNDIKNHNDKPLNLIRQVRDWFIETVKVKNIDGPTKIWYSFNDFMADFYEKRKKQGFSDEGLQIMAIPEFIVYIKEWCKKRK